MAEYVIYDQFHWLDPNHLESPCANRKEAIERYKFLKDAFPGESLGMLTKRKFIELKKSLTNKTQQQ